MTLRVTFEIVPHGDEANKYPIGTLNIHNGGGALGHCVYYGSYLSADGKKDSNYDFENVFHSRQEGFLVLTQKVLEEITNESVHRHRD